MSSSKTLSGARLSESPLLDPMPRANYHWFMPISSRWMDNDVYGHINNVNFYSYFDTVANTYLIRYCGLDMVHSQTIGYVVFSECNYKSSLTFPDALEGAFRVNKIGNTSVEYGLAVFKEGDTQASAYGRFTHVFVDRETERPVPISGELREGLLKALAAGKV